MAISNFLDWIFAILGMKRTVRLGIYGEVNVGKCLAKGQKVLLSDGTYENIENIFNRVQKQLSQKLNGIEDTIDCSNFNLFVPSLNKKTLKVEHQRITHVFRQRYKGKMYRIVTRYGREVIVSPEHPFVTINQDGIVFKKAKDINENSFLSLMHNFEPNIFNQNFIIPSRFEKTPLGIGLHIRHHYPKYIFPKWKLSKDLARFFAYVISESQHTPTSISFFNENQEFLNDFDNIASSFGLQTSHYNYPYKTPERKINSKVLSEYLSEVFDLQPGDSANKRIPASILKGKEYVVRHFLRTLFDCEGSVRTGKGAAKIIEMTSASKELIVGVQILLLRLGIFGKIRQRVINGKNYYVLEIGRSENHRKFKEKIGFSLNYKKSSLEKISRYGSKANIHSFPVLNLFEKIRKEVKLNKKDFYGPNLDSSLFKRKMITIDRIKKMSKKLLQIEAADFIHVLAGADVTWDKVEKIEPINYDGYIYDLTVNKNHTFSTWDGIIVHNTTLANRISKDWIGSEVGRVSEIPHETRVVQKKEKIVLKHGKKNVTLNLLDMPGLATKIDYKKFTKYGLSKRVAQRRAREATDGVIEAIKWLNNVDAVLAVMDSTSDPLSQVNVTLLGNLEARNIPVIIVANKIDKRKAKPRSIRQAFPHYPVVEVSALRNKNMDSLYEAIARYARRAK